MGYPHSIAGLLLFSFLLLVDIYVGNCKHTFIFLFYRCNGIVVDGATVYIYKALSVAQVSNGKGYL